VRCTMSARSCTWRRCSLAPQRDAPRCLLVPRHAARADGRNHADPCHRFSRLLTGFTVHFRRPSWQCIHEEERATSHLYRDHRLPRWRSARMRCKHSKSSRSGREGSGDVRVVNSSRMARLAEKDVLARRWPGDRRWRADRRRPHRIARRPSVDSSADWNEEPKSRVTLRQLLTMTGGIEDTPRFLDAVRLPRLRARAATGVHPGTVFSYSNESVMLFAASSKKAAGKPIDQFVRERYFAPLGITDAVWYAIPSGHRRRPEASSSRRAISCASVRSRARGRVERRTPRQRVVDGDEHGEPDPARGVLRLPLVGRPPGLRRLSLRNVERDEPVQGFFADGWGGNYVAVIPASRIVAIRTKDAEIGDEMPTRYSRSRRTPPPSATLRNSKTDPGRRAAFEIYTAHN